MSEMDRAFEGHANYDWWKNNPELRYLAVKYWDMEEIYKWHKIVKGEIYDKEL